MFEINRIILSYDRIGNKLIKLSDDSKIKGFSWVMN